MTSNEIQNFRNLKDLKELLKTSLEPRRTTQHLYLEIYTMEQGENEDIISYSMMIESL